MKIRVQYAIMAVAWIALFSSVTARHPWPAVCASLVFVLVSIEVSKSFNSDFSLTVGRSERHEVHFVRNQVTGRVRISVDGETQRRMMEIVSFRRSRRYTLSVGTAECVVVTFVKSRPFFFAPYRKQPIQVLVDGSAVVEF